MKLIYEGKSKKVYAIDDKEVFVEFKDEITAFNARVKSEFEGKGFYCFKISSLLFDVLRKNGIPTHYIEPMEMGFKAHRVKILPVEVVVRNFAAGSITKRLGIKEGTKFDPPIIEHFYKSDELGDPLICTQHIIRFGWMEEGELARVNEISLKATEVLTDYFSDRELILVDIKYEFGYTEGGKLVLADEISPDTFRVWTRKGESLDKDVFRKTQKNIVDIYRKLFEILSS